jgi:predicted dehydrogenase
VLRVGFVGTGGIAGRYLRTLAAEHAAGRATLLAACDLVAERAAAAARPFGAKVFSDWRQMLAATRCDAVFVCVPPFAHEGQEVAFAEAGSHLFVAKPVALDLAYARQVLGAVRRAGVLACSGYMWRYNAVNPEVQALLAQRPVGLVLGAYLGGLPGTPWWRRKAQSGGQMVEQTTHVFDLARFFVGEVESVCAIGSRTLHTDVPGMDTEDASVCQLRFACGAVGQVASCCAVADGAGRADLEVCARGLTLRYECERGFRAWVDGVERVGRNDNDPYDDVVRAFLQAVRAGEPALIRSPYGDAAQTLAVTLAAERSLQSGGVPTAVETVTA